MTLDSILLENIIKINSIENSSFDFKLIDRNVNVERKEIYLNVVK